MHIPDGYLSPQTYIPLWAAMVAYWSVAFRRVRDRISSAKLPLIAVGAAFSFVVMMFNVPVPGGTTGHAVGAGILAILLGPWAASVSISVALVIQALLFGDGGITALGANAFAMAVVGPVVAWLVYRALAARAEVMSRRRVWAGAIASYAGLNASALVTSVLFGLQPLIAHTASGQPLYAPYPLGIAVPAMMAEHLLLFGVVEAAVTAASVAWLQRTDPALLGGMAVGRGERRSRRPLWVALGVLAVLTPLGLWLPSLFHAGAAWGEWSPRELLRMIGFVPRGMAAPGYHAPLSGYALPGLGGSSGTAIAYVLAALLGMAAVAAIGWLLALAVERRRRVPPVQVPTAARHDEPLPPAAPVSERRKDDYIGRTLAGLGVKVRKAMAAEESASRDGWLQRADARVKVLAALALIAAASFTHRPAPLLALYTATLAAAVTSRVSMRTTLRRVWLVVPLFTAGMLLPATLNLVTPGEPLLVLAHFAPGAHIGGLALPADLAITRQGLGAATLALLRVVASVSVTVTLIATTRWNRLLAALRSMRVPAVFLMVAEMCYRYFFLLAGLARDDFLARRSRTIVNPSTAEGRRFVAGRVVGLLRRSLRLSEQVHAAMLSRGWTGGSRTLGLERVAASDVALAGIALLSAAAMIGFGRVA